jgi:SAM-dependent methyltransferase
MDEKIEILSVSLLDSERRRIDELKALARQLKLEFGWHYLLDISWILSQVERIDEQEIMDAGAGRGVIQWYLADKGATVISVDRESRENLTPRFHRRFKIVGLRPQDLASHQGFSGYGEVNLKTQAADWADQVRFALSRKSSDKSVSRGKVIIYNQDLRKLTDIADESIDYVVAVSSLEHNSPQDLETVVRELLRVLKPGGSILASLGAAKNGDWFHEPSQGWCYSEQTLRRVFDFSPEVPSNFSQYDQLFNDLLRNRELKVNLASFYFKSGDNGMPWGKWNPEYQPVGICKRKQ